MLLQQLQLPLEVRRQSLRAYEGSHVSPPLTIHTLPPGSADVMRFNLSRFFFSWPFFAAAVLLLQHERFDVAKGLATEGKRARVVVCVHWRGAECISLSFLVYPRTISGHFCVYSRSPVTTNYS